MQYSIIIPNVICTNGWYNPTHKNARLQNHWKSTQNDFASSSDKNARLQNLRYSPTDKRESCTASRTVLRRKGRVVQAGVQLYQCYVQLPPRFVGLYAASYNPTASTKSLQNHSVSLQNHSHKCFFNVAKNTISLKRLANIELHCHSPPSNHFLTQQTPCVSVNT